MVEGLGSMSSSHMRYSRVGKRSRCGGSKLGFRVNSRRKRCWVEGLRLRTRFFYLLKVLSRWRSCSSYGRALRLVVRKICVMMSNGSRNIFKIKRNNSSSLDVKEKEEKEKEKKSRMRTSSSSYPLRRSNSFYSEAIADCLDFIKSSSLSVSLDHPKQPVSVPQGVCLCDSHT